MLLVYVWWFQRLLVHIFSDCVMVLLDKGVSPNESGLSSLPPLHMAAKNGGKK